MNYDKEQEVEYLKDLNDSQIKNSKRFQDLKTSILDSSLITGTLLSKSYDFKIIECGKIKQIYYFKNRLKDKKINGYEKTRIKEDSKKDNLNKVLNANIEDKFYSIEELNEDLLQLDKYQRLNNQGDIKRSNLIRSKNQMARIVDCNADKFKTFITLTFEDNIQDYDFAYNEINKFRKKIKRVFPKLLLIAVREKQKNGRVHFHLLTNIDYNDKLLINENIVLDNYIKENGDNANLEQFKECNIVLKPGQKMNDLPIVLREQDGQFHNTKSIYDNETQGYRVFKTIKYWNLGFTNVEPISKCGGTINLARYMSKYMLKDLDKDLFNKHRYLVSGDLERPNIRLLNSENNEDFEEISKLFNLKVRYQNEYYDKFGNGICFLEVHSADNESKE